MPCFKIPSFTSLYGYFALIAASGNTVMFTVVSFLDLCSLAKLYQEWGKHSKTIETCKKNLRLKQTQNNPSKRDVLNGTKAI